MALEDGFEAWARAEVLRLRIEADLLKAMLGRYRGADKARVSHPASSDLHRNAPLLLVLEDAGAEGLTVGDVVEAAGRSGVGPRKAVVRSFLWNQVRAGRIALVGDRYVAAHHARETRAVHVLTLNSGCLLNRVRAALESQISASC